MNNLKEGFPCPTPEHPIPLDIQHNIIEVECNGIVTYLSEPKRIIVGMDVTREEIDRLRIETMQDVYQYDSERRCIIKYPKPEIVRSAKHGND